MENIYIIGDVHGCYRSLLALIEQLPRKFDSKICFVGDLIDRGPASADVVEFVRARRIAFRSRAYVAAQTRCRAREKLRRSRAKRARR